MSYFDGIKVGQKVWSFEYGWGKTIEIEKDYIRVEFLEKNIKSRLYKFDGSLFHSQTNQTLFWDKIKFEIPKKQKIELKECKYIIDVINENIYYDKNYLYRKINNGNIKNGLTRNDEETAESALKQIKIFTRLLALRDQECEDSRGYEYEARRTSYCIIKNADPFNQKYFAKQTSLFEIEPTTVYFKTKKDAQRICDILNENKFDLEK